ncbi:hypothetical protein SAMN06297387_11224 [Streptomyces zhaozhouensis]|uniref:Uncharacterized protein n=2 Tax=Streptomyces zhaozhouensis TaxID=1300267 RepID=A0A286DYB7_9ACTN|nr:hypothetical protein SAMN06297387_11224 [Streptomyces zhaozhouensis]
MTRADQGDRGELLRTFRESDPEVFEPQVTEWLEERGLLSTREVNTDG